MQASGNGDQVLLRTTGTTQCPRRCRDQAAVWLPDNSPGLRCLENPLECINRRQKPYAWLGAKLHTAWRASGMSCFAVRRIRQAA